MAGYIKVVQLLTVFLLVGSVAICVGENDDDFLEFDEDEAEFDFDDPDSGDFQDDGSVTVDYEDEDLSDEDDDDDGETFDGEEFEGAPATQRQTTDDITISESTVQMKPFWQAYIMELVIVVGMCLYLLNYFIGKSRNSTLAYSWFETHKDLLESNFALVGDNGEGDDPTEGELVKLAEDEFILWSSGRQCCTGMLVHINLCPRHDLFSVFTSLIQSTADTVTVIFLLDDDGMDSFVFAVGQKKALQKMAKEYQDLQSYSPNLKPVGRGSSELYQLSESGEVSGCVLNEKMLAFITKHHKEIQSIHISDQYTGKVQDTTDENDMVVVKKKEKRIEITFSVCSLNEETILMRFALQLLDHVKTIRLSKEGRAKAVRNRTKVSQSMEKLQHAQRQEAAQQRKEDKIKAAKEKMLTESDPDKQRKMEEKENKKARKRNQPKMKAMRVSSK